jgi:hypothetical protein
MKPSDIVHDNSAENFQVALLLGRIDGKLDRYAAAQEKLELQITVHNSRLIALEQDRAKVRGLLIGLSAAGGITGAGLVKALSTVLGAA